MTMHDDQLHVDEAVVRALVADQFPAWRDLPVQALVSSGTVNAIFRIGSDLAARFPLRPLDPVVARDWLVAEASAMRELAAASTVPVPDPVAIGAPGEGYPLPWAVQTWLPGTIATDDDPAASSAFAADLAQLVASLREADTRGRPFRGEGRGGHLPDHDAWMETCFAESEALLDVAPLRALWATLRTLPREDDDAMCHGDLTPANVLVHDGRLVGLLDGGGFGPADPALDLVSAWHLLDAVRREELRSALGCSDLQWGRGAAWALEQAMGLVWYYPVTNPSMASWGRRTLERLEELT